MQMSGKEFVNKILSGERDFCKIRLVGYHLSNQEVKELEDYLKKQDLQNNPITIEFSEFLGFSAENLYFPYTNGGAASFIDSDLKGAYLLGADFFKGKFKNVKLKGANLQGADFQEVDLYCVNFQGACLQKVNFIGAKLEEVDLRCVNGLEEAIGLALASYSNVKVTEKERKIVEERYNRALLINWWLPGP